MERWEKSLQRADTPPPRYLYTPPPLPSSASPPLQPYIPPPYYLAPHRLAASPPHYTSIPPPHRLPPLWHHALHIPGDQSC
ncbi:hypothetical protein KOW79_006964 [Hemibagrus wyckioides]|uniref:Uncharacterized protein n=1 Tax=Hemibagrus wyckioides TaxID=337641 RepID=A0A9D3SMH6_9TELE|nr:hypothetical protein KOW79_006964 [Hemibagrus wyckioides]